MLDLEFKLQRSKQGIAFFLGLLLFSQIIVLSLTIAAWLKVLLMLWQTIYLGRILWSLGLGRGYPQLETIRRLTDGRWQLTMKNQRYDVVLRGDSTVTTLLSVLRFQLPQRYFCQSCLIFRDALTADDYRRLLVALRMG